MPSKIPAEQRGLEENEAVTTPNLALANELADLNVAKEYLEWKESVPTEVRQAVEGVLKNSPEKTSKHSLPLVGQFFHQFRQSMVEGQLVAEPGIDKRVANLLKPLANVKTRTGGVIDVFKTMADPKISWTLRKKLYDLQIRPALDWLAEKDLEEAQEKITLPAEEEPAKEKEKSEDDSDLPDQSDEARSSMESGTEKGEGEPKIKFTVAPFFGGYYRQKIMDTLNPRTCRWGIKEEKVLETPELSPLDNLCARIIFGKVRGGQPLALPMPYNWGAYSNSLECSASGAKVLRDQNGLWHLLIEEPGVFTYRLKIAPCQTVEEARSSTEMNIAGNLPGEAVDALDKIKKDNPAEMKRAREIVKAVRAQLKYSNNPDVWKKYTANPSKFFEKVWQLKEADCFVSNTLAVRLLQEAGIPCRFIAGHFVKEKDNQDRAIMHSGSRHAWLEVWDTIGQHWLRLDATPKGDPTVDEDTQEQDLKEPGGEGDFGEDDEIMSEEDLQKKIKELKKEQAGSGGGKKTRERNMSDLEKERFATEAGCTPEQAAEFLRALERVREIKDKEGRPISDLLKDEWRKIVITRKIESMDYRGPVRMDEGDRLEDPVSAYIDIRGQEFNPTGFERVDKQTREEYDFGGINIYFSFDLSGSMSETDAATGRKKSDVQRDVALLFIDGLMQCAYISRQAGSESELLPIKIMATLASSRGQKVLSLTDRWGPAEQWKLYSALIKMASGGTPTHETLDIIESDMTAEQESLHKKRVPREKLPIHYVVEISDGSPDDFRETEACHTKLKNKGAAVRSYCIGGASASADAAPPLASFSELPAILTEDIIEKFKKLNPRRIKK